MDASEREQVFAFYLTVATELADAHEKIAKLRKQLEAFPATMVMQERPDDNRRPTHRHHRGEYLSPREAVTPDVPQFLKKDGEQAITNRLQLARWLVSRENPLAARVAVNRAWQEFFGDGFLKTSGDFGTQSPSPSHPQLLDWLACELIDDGWSMKRLHRRIVTSAAYRQESNSALEDRQTDPTNKWLARGPRHRLSGESVRDVMLHASGLLSSKMFGPSVRPPQPEIVVKVTYGNPGWASSQGEDRFRRSLYTFSKRTAPFAAYALFDAPSGENCIARRDRSNTPLQALTLLNDPMYLEMAEALAKLAMQEGTNDIDIATLVLRRLLTRPPTAEEVDGIVDFYQQQVQRLDDGELDSQQIAKTHSSEQAAWTMTARAVMNLDEVITKP